MISNGAELGPGPEFDLIRRMLGAAGVGSGSREGVLGPGDDAALVNEGRTAISTDLTVEGVHFRPEWISPRELGFRAVTAALSDMAAMAARPVGALLSIAIDRERAAAWAPEIAAGAGEALHRHGGVLLGGDLSRTAAGAPMVLDVTVVGEVDRPVLRSGSEPGDDLWVTGALGGAAAAVAVWTERSSKPAAPLRARFARPEARVEEARWLAEHTQVHALIDLSDGLAADASHLAAAGGVSIRIDAALVPVDRDAEAALGAERARALALTGGEDYELALTAPPGAVPAALEAFGSRFQVPLTRVGEVTTGSGLDIVGFESTGPGPLGWNHFGDG